MSSALKNMDDVVLCALAKEGDREAADVLIARHERFIWKTALPIAAKSDGRIDIHDLVQEGRIYLLGRIERFDPSCGVGFLSFAGKYLWVRLLQAANVSGVIRLPNKHTDLERALPVIRSLDEQVATQRGKARPFADLIEDDSQAQDLASNADDAERLTLLRNRMKALPETWQRVLTQRAGGRLLAEIADDMGITRERIRQIEVRALARLRQLCGAPESAATLTRPTQGSPP